MNSKCHIVRYAELQPCHTAFIDTHTPGSDKKENFCIIGPGVSESSKQHVHITSTPGFNIGAAGQPPGCHNSLHTHTTAEVFFVLCGKWRFFWGLHGNAGEVILNEGDIFNIPTNLFRGFENISNEYGMIMAILGGNDGGSIAWAPHVLEEAQKHGLVLGENGMLYDTNNGETLPADISPMPLLSEEQLKNIPETPVDYVVPNYVARYYDMLALASSKPCAVIGEHGLIYDRPGFTVDFLSRNSITGIQKDTRHRVYMVVRGHWRCDWSDNSEFLGPGDTCYLEPLCQHSMYPCMTGEAGLYLVCSSDEPAGETRRVQGKTR